MMYKYFCLLMFMIVSLINASDYHVPTQYIGASATSVSMGTSFFSNESNALFETDVLAQSGMAVSAFHVNSMGDYNTSVGSISMTIKNLVVGVGVAQAGTTGISITTQQGLDNEIVPTGETYNYTNIQYKGTVSYHVSESIGVGVGFNVYESDLYTSKGTGTALSVSTRVRFSPKLEIGVYLNNLYSDGVVFETATETLSMNMMFAFQSNLTKTLTFLGTLKTTASELEYETNQRASLGLSYQVLSSFLVRGVVFQDYSGLTLGTHIAVGSSLQLHPLQLNYAYKTVEYAPSSGQHFMSISFNLKNK